MALSQFDKILKEYRDSDNDYGFSAVSEEEYNAAINKAVTADDYKERLEKVEKIIIPFLTKLHSTTYIGQTEFLHLRNKYRGYLN